MVSTLLLAGVLVALLALLVLVVRLINDIKTAQRVSQGNRTIHPNSEPWEPTPRLTKEPPVFGGDSATFKEWTFAMDMALRSSWLITSSSAPKCGTEGRLRGRIFDWKRSSLVDSGIGS